MSEVTENESGRAALDYMRDLGTRARAASKPMATQPAGRRRTRRLPCFRAFSSSGLKKSRPSTVKTLRQRS
jgi:hypothetical protein